jgi:type IV pilus assembly protein PilB
VEYPLEGISQTQVSPKAGLSFAEALRSMLRQDPDVIMVGEIRDTETLDAAVFAALTGHLVLSTIHTNDAANTITRMLEMGLAPYLLSSALLGVVAQRLVRKICPFCAVTYRGADGGVDIPLLHDQLLSYGRGCPRCNGTGYAGRLGLFEVLPFTEIVREMVDSSASAYRIRQESIRDGMETLAMDGLSKILQGITTVQEVNRVLGTNWYEDLCLPSSIAPST